MKLTIIDRPLMLLVVSAFISTLGAYDPSLSWPILLTLLASVSLFFIITHRSTPIRPVGQGLVIAGSLVAFYFVSQYAYFDYLLESGWLADLGRAAGAIFPNFVFFISHPNAAATFVEGLFLLSLLLARLSQGFARAGWILAAIIIAYTLLISGSRGAWLGFIIVLGIWGVLWLPASRFRWLIAGAAVMALSGTVIFITIFVMNVAPDLSYTSLFDTFNSRFVLYRNSFYLLGDYPFTGIGPGDTFAMVYSRYQLMIPVPFLTYAHNLFLAVGLGQGLPGLIALVWLLLKFYRFVISVEQAELNSESRLLFRAGWAGVTVSLIHGLTDATQFSAVWTMPVLFALLGFTIAMGRPALMQQTAGNLLIHGEISTRSLVRRRGRPVVVGLGCIAATVVFWQPLLSAGYANLGAVHQTWADLSPATEARQRELVLATSIDYFERSLRLNPSQPVANRRLGLIALEYHQYDLAIQYLEQAYTQEPGNQATLKALGYAYLWHGQLPEAEQHLRRLDDQNELVEELGNWRNWWQSQNQVELSQYADQMIHLLLDEG